MQEVSGSIPLTSTIKSNSYGVMRRAKTDFN